MRGASKKLWGCWINAILILLIVSVSALAESQPPSPTPNETSQPPQHKAKGSKEKTGTEQRGTEQSPLMIKVIPTPKNQEEAAKEAKEHEEKVANDKAIIILTGALVSVGILQLFVFGLQARRLRQTVDKMDETAIRQLRAYVWGNTEGPSNIDAHNFSVHTVIENRGQTPAYSVHWWVELLAYDHPLPAGFKFKSAPAKIVGPKFVVNPGDKQSGTTMPDVPLTEQERIAIKDGNKGLYIWGEIRYRDAFGNDRKTYFRHIWSNKQGRTYSHWNHCDEGNDAD